MAYQLTEQAERDIYAVVDYIMPEAPEAALAVAKEIYRVCDLLGDTPLIGQTVDFITETEYRYFPAGKYSNYLIFYTCESETDVIIRRVIHGKQDVLALFE